MADKIVNVYKKKTPPLSELPKLPKLEEENVKNALKHRKKKVKPRHLKTNKKNKIKKVTKSRNGSSIKNVRRENKKIDPINTDDIEEKKNVKVLKPESRHLRIERDIAIDFAAKVQKKFDRLVKASILFGSQTKGDAVVGSDIDIILIVDDVGTNWDLELVAWYREELAKLVANQKYGQELHVNTVRLSTWWEDMLHGDPVVVNVLRYGEALIDYGGFFNPLKALLLNGKIRSTPEAVHAALRRAPMHIMRSKAAEMGAVEGVYWALVDSAQAALMTAGKMPPSPEHIPEMLKEVFVDAGMLKMNYVRAMKELYGLHKAIAHGNLNDIKGQEIDEWQDMAEKFMLEMTRIIDILLEKPGS
ncbi:nucleotidyltransferase domain-containing protein [Candidatus Pacearchaeota archaeon]|nr:nucleotidyltransferase domain-containing protein [Candidatus Pacearchaeota archaeon]